jgi:hypothetical protein
VSLPFKVGMSVRRPRARAATASRAVGRLRTSAFEGAGVGHFEELALRRSWAERRHFNTEAGHLRSQPQREEAVECLGGRIG